MTPAEIIRCSRVAAGLTQHELAGRVGVLSMTVSRWETGARQPTWAAVVAVVAACGCTARIVLACNGAQVAEGEVAP